MAEFSRNDEEPPYEAEITFSGADGGVDRRVLPVRPVPGGWVIGQEPNTQFTAAEIDPDDGEVIYTPLARFMGYQLYDLSVRRGNDEL